MTVPLASPRQPSRPERHRAMPRGVGDGKGAGAGLGSPPPVARAPVCGDINGASLASEAAVTWQR